MPTAYTNSPAHAFQNQPLASLGDRFLAQIADAIVAFGLLALTFPLSAISDSLAWLGIALFFAYYLLCDGLPNGQSVGKRLLKIRVVKDADGQSCSYGASALRNFAQILGILDWIWILGSKRKRAGDILAHTHVVSALPAA